MARTPRTSKKTEVAIVTAPELVKAEAATSEIVEFNHAPATRGFSVVFRENEVNYCPGCGGKSWIVGRITAECAFARCGFPLPIKGATAGIGAKRLDTRDKGVVYRDRAA